ncbi:hypothetical protein A3D05_04470 [Candidatus Gottesmanbacteria bacterium RIFCSPHIGHO2_02_FULL_40_24]|uniref:UDP-glucuronate decarboxylase n=1 Tax=Candidatus Gottesmanbacteria bacterium RIFCSPHIGHO2_01_FULL_40_15 TaxID=1798376 RepID=A0A1F5Z207_9BACT|nr:MAG: hypothetical protein A2777_05500 [Candidatus Gottesmanbacteria bacterium RIFCSPHIGHO2_01_FULL_40_15]OGG16124.1 MAG: hypothetical protein A3D05_04470 [Candidatus Gottesmanbacteria bacterium RIFCSPHIGHO2_02_FULL_40_24]OGG20865.1 MAG: hypothetical protein A3B48_06665 [Candidatus Gottesmanbacteria bacterium RIFCSPLOWO2_01_FULL_40_10]OGG25794.1 MAG: hypothetical protein A3E42_05740 [Candidatus Gottesmanbacteria bacterium RIFCSPHIGHO2_12_FULL_40_13]OGG32338.1 MAG: hypothetical protein A3I80_0
MKNKACIITGGAGFIGSHLCRFLLEKGYRVICLDNLLTGNIANIHKLNNYSAFRFLKTDVIQKDQVNKLIGEKNINYIYHLASPASPPQYRKLAIETLLVNSIGTLNMLNLSRKFNSRFLLASTSEVYGDPKEHPQKESYHGNVNPVGLRACYDEGKRFAEALAMEYFRKFRMDIRIIRIFNTYGPNMLATDGRVISNFLTQALSGKPLTIYGSGDQTRSFCYVSDMVEGLVSAMENNNSNGQVINLGNPDEIQVRKLARLVLNLTKSKSKLVNVNKRLEDDPEKRKPDISKAISLLKWTPRIDLIIGLTNTVKFFRDL